MEVDLESAPQTLHQHDPGKLPAKARKRARTDPPAHHHHHHPTPPPPPHSRLFSPGVVEAYTQAAQAPSTAPCHPPPGRPLSALSVTELLASVFLLPPCSYVLATDATSQAPPTPPLTASLLVYDATGHPLLDTYTARCLARLHSLPPSVTWAVLTDGVRWRFHHRSDFECSDVCHEETLGPSAIPPSLVLLLSPDICSPPTTPPGPSGLRHRDLLLAFEEEYREAVARHVGDAVRDGVALLYGWLVADGLATEGSAHGAGTPAATALDFSLLTMMRLVFIVLSEDRGSAPPHHEPLQSWAPSPSSPAPSAWFRVCRAVHAFRTHAPATGLFHRVHGLEMPSSPGYSRLAAAPRHTALARALALLHRGTVVVPLSHGGRQCRHALPVRLSVLGPFDVGRLYEGLLGLAFHARSGEGASTASSLQRLRTSSFYTPRLAVRALVHDAVGRAVDGAVLGATATASARSPLEAVLALRVLDPAMGCGNFLLAAAELLTARASRLPGAPALPELRRLVVGRCLYGVDRSETAVLTAKSALALFAPSATTAAAAAVDHFRHGDSLLGCIDADQFASAERAGVAFPASAFHWHCEFPELLAETQPPPPHPEFDAVLLNPPWDVLQPNKRAWYNDEALFEADKASYELLKTVLKRSGLYELGYDGTKCNAFMPFLERSVRLLRPGGQFACIVPSSLLSSSSSLELRHWLAGRLALRGLLEFGKRRLFPGVNRICIAALAHRRRDRSGASGGGSAPEPFPYAYAATAARATEMLATRCLHPRPGAGLTPAAAAPTAVLFGPEALLLQCLPDCPALNALLRWTYGGETAEAGRLLRYGDVMQVCTGVYLYRFKATVRGERSEATPCRVLQGTQVGAFACLPLKPGATEVWAPTTALRGHWSEPRPRLLMRSVRDFKAQRRFLACAVSRNLEVGDHSTTVHELRRVVSAAPVGGAGSGVGAPAPVAGAAQPPPASTPPAATAATTTHLMAALMNSKLLEWVFRSTDRNDNINTNRILGLPIPALAARLAAPPPPGAAEACIARLLGPGPFDPISAAAAAGIAADQGLCAAVLSALGASLATAAPDTPERRERLVCVADVVVCALYGISGAETCHILRQYHCGFFAGVAVNPSEQAAIAAFAAAPGAA